jgi:hypothetical protein
MTWIIGFLLDISESSGLGACERPRRDRGAFGSSLTCAHQERERYAREPKDAGDKQDLRGQLS